MASIPKIKVELDVVETEELKKTIAAELDKISRKAKAEIDTAVADVFNKYIGKAKDKENGEAD